MEKLTSLNERTKENISGAKQATAWSHNQEVLNNLGENENGELTFKGQPLERKTAIITDKDIYVMITETRDNNGMVLSTSDVAILPENTEIKAIYITYNGKRYDIRCLSAIDGIYYGVEYNKVVHSEDSASNWIATIWSPSAEGSDIILSLRNFITFDMEIEYYI